MAEKHYYEQVQFTNGYLIPYFEKYFPGFRDFNILEVGCAEGGFLKALNDAGIKARGIELEQGRVDIAKKLNPGLEIEQGDVTDRGLPARLNQKFDLIVLRDVIEHVPGRDAAFAVMHEMLKDKGALYITFPPKYSAFAGHQQNGRTFLRKTPFLHLLPGFFTRWLGRLANERPGLIEMVIHNYKTGLTIKKFDKLCQKYGFSFIEKKLFLIRPVFQMRFGLRPRRIPNVPFFREFLAMGYECLIARE